MRIRQGYMLRQVMDMYVIIGVGSEAYAPNRIMSLNEAGAFLWRMLENGAGRGALVDALAAEYDIDPRTAGHDVDAFLSQLREKALIDE